MNSNQTTFIDALDKKFPTQGRVFTRRQIEDNYKEFGLRYSEKLKLYDLGVKVGRGEYSFDSATLANRPAPVTGPVSAVSAPAVTTGQTVNTAPVMNEVFVPEKNPDYVRWGHCSDIESIIKSRMFFPTYIAGLSGNGKTMMVEQACARLKREYVRVQMTPETDEDDLIGGFRLIDGETVFVEGPVIKAMRSGAILLIDEIDRASNRLMALQGVMEGKPVLIKKTHEVVTPTPGFNVIATANTYGQGSYTGNFSAATIIDEALLERFSVVFTQEDPRPSTETNILKKLITSTRHSAPTEQEETMIERLVTWADTVRKSFKEDAIESTISTRRLCHIAKTYLIFGDVEKAVNLCVSRFEPDTKLALVDLYSKIDDTIEAQRKEAEEAANKNNEEFGFDIDLDV